MGEQGAFFSIWAQESSYWLVFEGQAAPSLPGLAAVYHKIDLAAIKVGADWYTTFEGCASAIAKLPCGGTGYRVAAIPAEELPSLQEIMMALKPLAEMSAIATNLWLIESVNHGKLDCYMQRVVDRRGAQVGYEAFARMETADGGVIGGGAIMKAAHALRVEYQLDRLLHKQAIESFVEHNLEGYIFINFLSGFVHRPEVYLDGLSQAVSRMRIRPGSVVLDVTLTDYSKDMNKLKSIAQYCRSRGFGLALDDVNSSEGLALLLSDIRPSFVKLDVKFGAGLTPVRLQGLLHEIVRVSHATGVVVLAEGVESKPQHDLYLEAGVDMFQGYLFGAPERLAKSDTKTEAANA